MSSETWEIETKDFIIFNKGILSSDYCTEFCSNLTVDGKLYNFNSATQYIAASKAKLFNDNDMLERILDEDNIQKQKQLEQQIKNVKEDKWFQECRQIVYNGTFDKFYQNDKIFSLLVSTENKTIVASLPTDRIWGIGVSCDDIKVKFRHNWRGRNWLGQVLMKIREDLRNGVEYTFEYIDWDM